VWVRRSNVLCPDAPPYFLHVVTCRLRPSMAILVRSCSHWARASPVLTKSPHCLVQYGTKVHGFSSIKGAVVQYKLLPTFQVENERSPSSKMYVPVENFPRSIAKSTDFPAENVTTGFGRCRQGITRAGSNGNEFINFPYVPVHTVHLDCATYVYQTDGDGRKQTTDESNQSILPKQAY
jgi:hypothetical protein